MAKDLFLEIGCEEIPAGFIPKAMADMEAIMKRELGGALGGTKWCILSVSCAAAGMARAARTAAPKNLFMVYSSSPGSRVY